MLHPKETTSRFMEIIKHYPALWGYSPNYYFCLDIDGEKLQKKDQSESNLILFSLLPLDFIPTFTEIFSYKLDLLPNQFCKSEVAFGSAAKVYDLAT